MSGLNTYVREPPIALNRERSHDKAREKASQ